jgi:hypothetical protein
MQAQGVPCLRGRWDGTRGRRGVADRGAVMMRRYSVRYVHKISPRETDVAPDIELSDDVLAHKAALGKALRACRVLQYREPIQQFRIEADGRVCVFPGNYNGITTGWHCIVLSPVAEGT